MLSALAKCALLLAFVVSCSALAQKPFSVGLGVHSYDAGPLSPVGDLGTISTSGFTTLGHSAFPHYNVRVKQSRFCDGSVRAFTGYIDIEARHLFFYFFESRSDPDKDDVIFWTNGGPGCSSSMGLFMELGPCRVNDVDNVTFNPFSWNEKANIFFIDQPIGTGYSYADHGEYVSTTEEAAKDILAFIAIFFEHFATYKGRAFHLAGESYAGRLLPVYASVIYDQNPSLVAAGMEPINLSSIMIGNGGTDLTTMLPSYYDFQCQHQSVPPVMDIATCIGIKQGLPRCEKWLKESCYDIHDRITCAAAYNYCITLVHTPFLKTGYNPYDITKPCTLEELADSLCYPETKKIDQFLSRPDIRESIGVDPSVPVNFTGCNLDIYLRFQEALDQQFPTEYYIAALLERGVRVLIYVGANDWVCNWLGNERMTLALEWTGKDSFVSQPLSEWKVNNHSAGLMRSHGPLTFATIFGGGHMAPYDKPKESLEMVQRWLAREPL